MTARAFVRAAWLLSLAATACASAPAGSPWFPGGGNRASRIRPPDFEASTAAGVVDRAAEVRVDVAVEWQPTVDTTLSLRLAAATVHGRDAWSGLLAGAHWSAGARVRPWFEVGGGIGSGNGASRVLRAAAGVKTGHFGFAMNNVRWRDGLVPRLDSVIRTGADQLNWRNYGEAEVTTVFQSGQFRFEAVGGVRVFGRSGEDNPWASAMLAAGLGRLFELQAAAGTRPARPELGQPAGSFAQIGLALRTSKPAPPGLPPAQPPGQPPVAPPALHATPTSGGGWNVAIRIPSARSVEINGDITGWAPLELRRSKQDATIWIVRLDVDAGVYLVALRVDGGAWSAPPGLPVVPDGFGGRAGLLTLN